VSGVVGEEADEAVSTQLNEFVPSTGCVLGFIWSTRHGHISVMLLIICFSFRCLCIITKYFYRFHGVWYNHCLS